MLFIVVVLVAWEVISIHMTCVPQKHTSFVSAELTTKLFDSLIDSSIHCLIGWLFDSLIGHSMSALTGLICKFCGLALPRHIS